MPGKKNPYIHEIKKERKRFHFFSFPNYHHRKKERKGKKSAFFQRTGFQRKGGPGQWAGGKAPSDKRGRRKKEEKEKGVRSSLFYNTSLRKKKGHRKKEKKEKRKGEGKLFRRIQLS